MSTPEETAAEAARKHRHEFTADGSFWSHQGDAHDQGFIAGARWHEASLAEHRDDIARVLATHQPAGFGCIYCSCARWPHDERDDETFDGHARHQADAVLAYLREGDR